MEEGGGELPSSDGVDIRAACEELMRYDRAAASTGLLHQDVQMGHVTGMPSQAQNAAGAYDSSGYSSSERKNQTQIFGSGQFYGDQAVDDPVFSMRASDDRNTNPQVLSTLTAAGGIAPVMSNGTATLSESTSDDRTVRHTACPLPIHPVSNSLDGFAIGQAVNLPPSFAAPSSGIGSISQQPMGQSMGPPPAMEQTQPLRHPPRQPPTELPRNEWDQGAVFPLTPTVPTGVDYNTSPRSDQQMGPPSMSSTMVDLLQGTCFVSLNSL